MLPENIEERMHASRHAIANHDYNHLNDALERQTFRYGCIEVDVRFFRLHYVRAKVARR